MSTRAKCGLLAAALLTMWPTGAAATAISGKVVDAHGAPVADADVAVACGEWRETYTTDRLGRFAAAPPSARDCVIFVSRSGFATAEQRVDRPDVVVRLTVALAEIVKVTAAPAIVPGRLRTVAGSTVELIAYIKQRAGASTRRAIILVDGLPAASLPPLDTIAHISVDPSPFAPEHSDGEATTIDIVTKAPGRTLRIHGGTGLPAIRVRDGIDSALQSTSLQFNAGVQGPVPLLPLTFTAAVASGDSSDKLPLRPGVPGLTSDQAVTARNRDRTAMLGLSFSVAASSHGRVLFRESRSSRTNAGVGGITLQEAGLLSQLRSRNARATLTHASSKFLLDGGVTFEQSNAANRANATTPGIAIGGDVVMGGAPIADERRASLRWTAKQVIRAGSAAGWAAGVILNGSRVVNEDIPNPGGTFYFEDVDAYRAAVAGAGRGTWQGVLGPHATRLTDINGALFMQSDVIRRPGVTLGGGLRVDMQNGIGMLPSPRLWVTTTRGGAVVRAGGGLFAQPLPQSIYLAERARASNQARLFLSTAASWDEHGEFATGHGVVIGSRISPGVTFPRSWLWTVSVQRPFKWLTPTVEYSAARDQHLLGSTRERDRAGWVDLLEANRAARRHRVRAWAHGSLRRVQVTVDYEFNRAFDNTDGPFSFAAEPGRLDAEWAPSAVYSPHNVSGLVMLALPWAITATIADTWRSGAPYTITTVSDTQGNGLLINRGNRPRNSAMGPDFHSTSLYAHRRFDLMTAWKMRRRVGLNIALQVDNLFSRSNYLGIGSVAESANFGAALAAYPGRSMRVLVNFD